MSAIYRSYEVLVEETATGHCAVDRQKSKRKKVAQNDAWAKLKTELQSDSCGDWNWDALANSTEAELAKAMQAFSGDESLIAGVARFVWPLQNQSVDVVSIAFGIRNVADWGAAVDEFYRVLRPGGRLIILEFSLPSNLVLRGLYNFYFRRVLPRTATFISGDKSGAYHYLPESVNTFISCDQMTSRMRAAGLTDVQAHGLTMGVCYCYRGVRHA